MTLSRCIGVFLCMLTLCIAYRSYDSMVLASLTPWSWWTIQTSGSYAMLSPSTKKRLDSIVSKYPPLRAATQLRRIKSRTQNLLPRSTWSRHQRYVATIAYADYLLSSLSSSGTGAGAWSGNISSNLSGSPLIGSCTIFPSDNPRNTDISSYPLHTKSASYIATINTSKKYLHPDFWANRDGWPFGIPYVIVNAQTSKIPVKAIRYADESDEWNFPVPRTAPVEKWGDRHVIAVDTNACMLYELFAAELTAQWRNAGSVAVFNLRSNTLRPDGRTSADAAWLAIFPGLVRYDEVAAGQINHALRFTVSQSQKWYIAPATHQAGKSTDVNLPPMGLRLRMKADYDISHIHGQARVIAEALKKYGMIVADNGSDRFISGAPDSRWDDEDLGQLKTIPGSAFEAVDTWPIQR